MSILDKKKATINSLEDYIIRSINLYDRNEGLKDRFASTENPEFLKYIDTEAILYHREIQEVGVPFPSSREMLTVGGETDLRIFLSIGYECFKSIRRFLPTDINNTAKVLDFGVGCARTMRHFYREVKNFECYGCDVDKNAIDYLESSIQFIKASVTNNLPPLHYKEHYFDFVYSISVFTHLDRSAFIRWINEISRILKKGGIFEISLHGSKAFEIIENQPDRRSLLGINKNEFELNKEKYQTEGYIWIKQPVCSDDIDTSQFGISFISQACFKKIISPHFTLIDYFEGEIGGWQDLAILKK